MMFLSTLSQRKGERGALLMTAIVFGSVFLLLVTALIEFLISQRMFLKARVESERALNIAEAGLEYYKWFLAHYPNDFTNGTGMPGPYIIPYHDPEGGVMGEISLNITGNIACNITSSVDIASTGATTVDPARTRTVTGRYARPTVADYAYIINDNVWAGADRQIYGPYHSNGGIRMDGTNYSTVTSGQTSWLCTATFGCSPNQTQNGVFGAGSGASLWQFPAPPISFAGITVDLVSLKNAAQTYGLYFPQISGGSAQRGYRVVLHSNNTADIYRVDNSTLIWSYDLRDNNSPPLPYADRFWRQRYEIVSNETFLGNYVFPTGCPVLFVEDRVWLQGVVGSKITVAAANIASPPYAPDIILNGNITYTTTDGSVGLTAIAQNDITIPLLSPDHLTLHGIFIAQNGRFGRNHYRTSSPYNVPSAYNSYVIQSSITTLGTVVSSGRVGERWTSGGTTTSGYLSRTNSYHAALAQEPPPLTPTTSTDYRLIIWREQ